MFPLETHLAGGGSPRLAQPIIPIYTKTIHSQGRARLTSVKCLLIMPRKFEKIIV